MRLAAPGRCVFTVELCVHLKAVCPPQSCVSTSKLCVHLRTPQSCVSTSRLCVHLKAVCPPQDCLPDGGGGGGRRGRGGEAKEAGSVNIATPPQSSSQLAISRILLHTSSFFCCPVHLTHLFPPNPHPEAYRRGITCPCSYPSTTFVLQHHGPLPHALQSLPPTYCIRTNAALYLPSKCCPKPLPCMYYPALALQTQQPPPLKAGCAQHRCARCQPLPKPTSCTLCRRPPARTSLTITCACGCALCPTQISPPCASTFTNGLIRTHARARHPCAPP